MLAIMETIELRICGLEETGGNAKLTMLPEITLKDVEMTLEGHLPAVTNLFCPRIRRQRKK
jgi:hypothetical protein